jgi:multidrug resistance efflux pump
MKFKTRIRFFIGLIAVVVLSASLFVYLDYSMSRVTSVEAKLESDTYTVGIEYSGIIEKQYIEEDSFIESNDPLFEIRSSTLSTAIRNNEIAKSSLLYSVSDDGIVMIRAAAPGRVQSIEYRQGAFVPANSRIAVVNIKNKSYISATYKLNSPDYSRLTKESRIKATFPDNKTVQGTIYDISLQTVDKEIQTTVRARFDAGAINTAAFTVGTPVETTLYLDSDTWYNRTRTNIQTLFQPQSGK